MIDTRSVFQADKKRYYKENVFPYDHLVTEKIISYKILQMNLPITVPLAVAEKFKQVSHCVWTVLQKGGRCGKVAVSEGSTVLLILN